MDILARRFVFHGVLVFFLGLAVGLLFPLMLNARLGLSAHLAGIINGAFLVALGAVWPMARLSRGMATAAFWLLLYGAYMNLIANVVGGFFGTSRFTPIAGAGHTGPAWAENFVAFGLLSLTGAMLVGSALLVYGFLPRRTVS